MLLDKSRVLQPNATRAVRATGMQCIYTKLHGSSASRHMGGNFGKDTLGAQGEMDLQPHNSFNGFADALGDSVMSSDLVVVFFNPDTDGHTAALAFSEAITIFGKFDRKIRTMLIPLPNGDGNKLNNEGEGPLNTFLRGKMEEAGRMTVIFLDVSPMDVDSNKCRVIPKVCTPPHMCFIVDEHPKGGDDQFINHSYLLHRMYKESAPDGAFDENDERMLSTAGLVWFLVQKITMDLLRKSKSKDLIADCERWVSLFHVCLSIANYADSGYKKYRVQPRGSPQGVDSEVPFLPTVRDAEAVAGGHETQTIRGPAVDNKLLLMHYSGLSNLEMTGHFDEMSDPSLLENASSLLEDASTLGEDWWEHLRMQDSSEALRTRAKAIAEFWQTQFRRTELWFECDPTTVRDDMSTDFKGWERGKIIAWMFDVEGAIDEASVRSPAQRSEYMFIYHTQRLPFLLDMGPKTQLMRADHTLKGLTPDEMADAMAKAEELNNMSELERKLELQKLELQEQGLQGQELQEQEPQEQEFQEQIPMDILLACMTVLKAGDRDMERQTSDVFSVSRLNQVLKDRDIFFLFPSTTPRAYNKAVFTGVSVTRNGPFAGTNLTPDYSLTYQEKAKKAGSGCQGIILSRGQGFNSGAGVTVKRIRTRDGNGMQQEVFQIGYPDPRETWTPLWQSMEPKPEAQFGNNGYGRADRQDDDQQDTMDWIKKTFRNKR